MTTSSPLDLFKSLRQIYFFYFLSQIIPMFLMGGAVFISIIMMMQFLQISEFLLIHNVGLVDIGRICFYMCISFLPIVFPMSLLFSILLTYARMSVDSEVVAFKSLGYSLLKLALPGIAFSLLVSFLSAQALFYIGPSARLSLDLLTTSIGNQKIMSGIQQGTFSENFFSLVLYANKVDDKKNIMNDVFIFDGRNADHPIVIVAKTGAIKSQSDATNQSASIVLGDGSMSNLGGGTTSKLYFQDYSLTIASPVERITESKDANTFTISELRKHIEKKDVPEPQLKEFIIENHQRWATIATCVLFGFLGAALGSGINRRSGSSVGFIMTIICIVVYYLLYSTMRNWANKSSLPPAMILWIPNMICLIFTAWSWRRASK